MAYSPADSSKAGSPVDSPPPGAPLRSRWTVDCIADFRSSAVCRPVGQILGRPKDCASAAFPRSCDCLRLHSPFPVPGAFARRPPVAVRRSPDFSLCTSTAPSNCLRHWCRAPGESLHSRSPHSLDSAVPARFRSTDAHLHSHYSSADTLRPAAVSLAGSPCCWHTRRRACCYTARVAVCNWGSDYCCR